MENLQTIVALAGSAFGMLITTITFISKFIKSSKLKKVAEDMNRLEEVIKPFVIRAEEFVNYTGIEKKTYVLTAVNEFAIKSGINFDVNWVSEQIEKVVALSNNVNTKKKENNNGNY